MTRNDWEAGEIVLPTAEFARVRKAVADSVAAEQQTIYGAGQRFWSRLTGKQKRNAAEYYQASQIFFASWNRNLPDAFWDAATSDQGRGPQRIRKEDLEFPTSRMVVFRAGREGYIVFDRDSHSASWTTGENNHAVENARGSATAATFFRSLGTVAWTRGSGGVITGNDEYNQDSREAGSGANYTTAGFGPIGAQRTPASTSPFRMADGTSVARSDFPQLRKASADATRQGRRPARAPGGTGGQFADRRHSAPETTLQSNRGYRSGPPLGRTLPGFPWWPGPDSNRRLPA